MLSFHHGLVSRLGDFLSSADRVVAIPLSFNYLAKGEEKVTHLIETYQETKP